MLSVVGIRYLVWKAVFIMLTAIFIIALIYVFFRMLIWGIKAAWGIAKFIAFVVLLPLVIVGIALLGLFSIALAIVILCAGLVTVLGFLGF